MKPIITLILILSITNLNCQITTDLSNIEGVEIFFLQNDKKIDSNIDLERLKHNEKECRYSIDIENIKAQTLPFLSKDDIESFDWINSRINLTKSGIEKLDNLDVPVFGLPFVIKINGNIIYPGWFWSIYSSSVCDRVYATKNQISNQLYLDFGGCGVDPRLNETLIKSALKI